jgi:hypothetical protein
MKKYSIGLFVLVGVIFLTGCADYVHVNDCVSSEPDGFFSGFWHGLTLCFSFLGRMFSDDIAMYAVNNNGRWYDLGFALGTGNVMIWIRTVLGVISNILDR